ncbi:MAG: hypothetical protein H6Q41_797 [Deltaproteobacteria bacterium]|nr:hypothetical protein [Deltaproteobacteria bacterium]
MENLEGVLSYLALPVLIKSFGKGRVRFCQLEGGDKKVQIRKSW